LLIEGFLQEFEAFMGGHAGGDAQRFDIECGSDTGGGGE
jgi:hypothetical protein